MHWDPGPYWDWDHFMDLLGQQRPGPDATHSRMVSIAPYYGTNRPPLTDCGPDPCQVLPHQPASFVYLYTEPATGAPLIGDPAVRPGAGTTQIDDLRDKASSGQRFVVAERRAGWTAIWFGGARRSPRPGRRQQRTSTGTDYPTAPRTRVDPAVRTRIPGGRRLSTVHLGTARRRPAVHNPGGAGLPGRRTGHLGLLLLNDH